MKPSSVLVLFAAVAPLAAEADTPPTDVQTDTGAGEVSFHVGAGISVLIVPSLQLQLEGKSWFAGADAGRWARRMGTLGARHRKVTLPAAACIPTSPSTPGSARPTISTSFPGAGLC